MAKLVPGSLTDQVKGSSYPHLSSDYNWPTNSKNENKQLVEGIMTTCVIKQTFLNLHIKFLFIASSKNLQLYCKKAKAFLQSSKGELS